MMCEDVKLQIEQMSGQSSARQELNKTKEQLEEEKKISMSFRIKPLDISGLSADVLKKKAQELWEQIIRLETEKYDLEERQKRQDYDVSTPLEVFIMRINVHVKIMRVHKWKHGF